MGDVSVLRWVYLPFCVEHNFELKGGLRIIFLSVAS
jgi:hypothetical protein